MSIVVEMICNCFRRGSALTKEQKDERKISKFIEKQIAIWMKEYRKSIKILLLGKFQQLIFVYFV